MIINNIIFMEVINKLQQIQSKEIIKYDNELYHTFFSFIFKWFF